jgi:ribose-phosphate pyrophosphokinase
VSCAVHGFEGSEVKGRALAEALGIPFGLVATHRFPDGELLVTVPERAPEAVIVFLSLDRPNEKLIELTLAAEAWRRQGVRRLVLAAPYLAYMRQDRAFAPGQAISQRAIGRALAGLFDRIVTVDAHLHRTHSLAEVFGPVWADDLTAAGPIGDWLEAHEEAHDILLLGPDEESRPLVEATARSCGAAWLTFEKTRKGDADVELQVPCPHQLAGRDIVLIDDIASSGATLAAAARAARRLGARRVRAVVVHALLDSEAAAELERAGIVELVSTDSVTHPTNAIPLAPLLAGTLTDEVRR